MKNKTQAKNKRTKSQDAKKDRAEKCWQELASHYFPHGKTRCLCGKREISADDLKRYVDTNRRGNK